MMKERRCAMRESFVSTLSYHFDTFLLGAVCIINFMVRHGLFR